MQALFFYLTYPFIYAIASLPFSVLYRVSDLLYHLLKLTGYRKEVILSNLRNSFPDKSPTDLEALSNQYYRYLGDLIVETCKTLKMSEQEARERCRFHDAGWLNKLYGEKKSVILVLGHSGNWEWAGPSVTLNTNYQLVVIYRPLSNVYFEKMMTRMRTKFGTRITPVNLTLRDMVANRGLVTATAFIGDQAACQDTAYWTTFLNQDTAVFTGPEKLAVKFNYPVVYLKVERVRRGYYEVFVELLFENPKNTVENEISEAYTKRLELDILKNPSIWLWSHRRWKHARPKSDTPQTQQAIRNKP